MSILSLRPGRTEQPQRIPGPWTIESAGYLWRITRPGGMSMLRGTLEDAEKARDHENAAWAAERIRDAAPDMLSALRDALWVIDNMSAIMDAEGLKSTLTDPRPAMRAAIAKSEGST